MDAIRVERTKRRFPAIWESGGYSPSKMTGKATALCSPNGAPLRYVFQNKYSKAKNADHALFIIRAGDVVAQTSLIDETEIVRLSRISDITNEAAHLSPIAESKNGIWDTAPQGRYARVISASRSIAKTPFCWMVVYGTDAKDFN